MESIREKSEFKDGFGVSIPSPDIYLTTTEDVCLSALVVLRVLLMERSRGSISLLVAMLDIECPASSDLTRDWRAYCV